jgi:hypothetical protein
MKMENVIGKKEIYIIIDKLLKEINRELEGRVILNGSNILDKFDDLKYYIEKLKESE